MGTRRTLKRAIATLLAFVMAFCFVPNIPAKAAVTTNGNNIIMTYGDDLDQEITFAESIPNASAIEVKWWFDKQFNEQEDCNTLEFTGRNILLEPVISSESTMTGIKIKQKDDLLPEAGDYRWQITAGDRTEQGTVSIGQLALQNAIVVLDQDGDRTDNKYSYTGAQIHPTFSIYSPDGSVAIPQGESPNEQYTAEYEDDTIIGQHTITITSSSTNLSGSAYKYYGVEQRDVTIAVNDLEVESGTVIPTELVGNESAANYYGKYLTVEGLLAPSDLATVTLSSAMPEEGIGTDGKLWVAENAWTFASDKADKYRIVLVNDEDAPANLTVTQRSWSLTAPADVCNIVYGTQVSQEQLATYLPTKDQTPNPDDVQIEYSLTGNTDNEEGWSQSVPALDPNVGTHTLYYRGKYTGEDQLYTRYTDV